jgi:excisionase family DNA binding protein
MTRRRPSGASAPTGSAADEDTLVRLLRTIARQAAQEAFNAFRESQHASPGPGEPQHDSLAQPGTGIEETTSNADQPPGSAEQFFSVAAVAKTLEVSEKTVRRKIAGGELSANRMGPLLRVSERDLAAYVARTRLGRSMSK